LHFASDATNREREMSIDGFEIIKRTLIDAGIIRMETTSWQSFPVIEDENAFRQFDDDVKNALWIIKANTEDWNARQPPVTRPGVPLTGD
jgi:hypothetical protein